MAHTKQTSSKVKRPKDPNVISKGEEVQSTQEERPKSTKKEKKPKKNAKLERKSESDKDLKVKGMKPVKNLSFVKKFFFQQQACLKEIRRAQKSLDLAIPRLPFLRLCKEIAKHHKNDLLWQMATLACL